MTEPNFTFAHSATLVGGSASIGSIMVLNAAGTGFVLSTSAARASAGRRSAGVARSASDSANPAFVLQQTGWIPASITGLGDGVACAVKCSDAGAFERVVSPTGDDDVMGRCDTDGTVYLTSDAARGAAEAVSSSTAGTCTLEMFGAVGDGVTSDQTAFATAIDALEDDTYSVIILGAGKTYLITGDTVPAGCAILGQGDSSVLKTTTDAAVLIVGGENVTLSNFKILGSGAGSSQVGIKIGVAGNAASGYSKVRIGGVTFASLGADGIQYNQNPFTPYDGPRVSDCLAKSCGTGYRTGTRGEYITFSNCHAESCTLGVYVGSGNVTFDGCNIVGNVTNVNVAAGTNDAHGIFSACNINHPTGATNITIGAIVNGHTFTGCHIYQGAVACIGAGVRFVNCIVDVGSISATNYALEFDDCTFPGSEANTISEASGGEVHLYGARNIEGNAPGSFVGRRQAGVWVSGNEAYLGTDPSFTAARQADAVRVYVKSGGTGYLGVASTGVAYWTSTAFTFVQPVTATLADPVITGIPTYTGTRVNIKSKVGETQTSGTSPTTVVSWTMANETLVAFDVIVTVAKRTSVTKGGRFKRSVVYRRTGGGSPTIVGTLESGTDQSTDDDTVTIDTSSNDVRVRFTANDSDDRNITAEMRVQEQTAA